MKDNRVVVSVYCLAYNQENYIKDALEGFISQKTDFSFEVIVHDDASTDDTPSIIKEYAQAYPDIIKPIFQTQNQYPKGFIAIEEHIKPLVRGKYIAICEGDDYWTDSNKLQKQVDFLEKNLDYSACVHNTYLYDMDSNKKQIMYGKNAKTLTLKDVIHRGGESFHTSSLMYRAQYFFNKPEYFQRIKHVGDYPMAIYLATQGKIYYLSDEMSLYRYKAAGSWTLRQNREKKLKLYKNSIDMLLDAKMLNKPEYSSLFDEAIHYYEYEWRKSTGDFSVLKESNYRKFYKQESNISKLKIFIKKNIIKN